ncbi:MAG: glycosyltransferase family 4 protein [bacterium]
MTPEYAGPDSDTGGLGAYLRKTAAALTARGHRVSVFLQGHEARSWDDGAVRVYVVARARPWPWARHLRWLANVAPAIRQIRSARALAAKVWQVHARQPIDLIQTSSFMAPGLMVIGNGRIPVVCRASSYTPLWRAAYGTRRNAAQYLCDGLELRQFNGADAVYAPSRFLSGVLARFEGLHVEVIRTPLPAPVHGDRAFYESRLKSQPYLLHFGALSRLKDTDLLGQAMPAILARHPQLRLVVIGGDNGVPDGRRMGDVLRADLGAVADRLLVHAQISPDSLIPVIAGALGVLMPFRADNYSNACLEAQAQGIPVVGTMECGLDELITDGQTGFLIRQADPASLTEGVERLLAMNAGQRGEMIQRIRASVAAMAAEDRIGQLLDYYADVICRFRGTNP